MESQIYNITGKSVGKINLPESIFGISWNGDLVHQVLTSEMSNKRAPIAHTKTRGEVRGGGKKPWKQKGTGRARHGSRRSPIWVGGGVAHGPRNDKNFERKVNRKTKAKALLTILSKKYKDGEIVFIDSINFEAPKAKLAKNFLDSISKVKGFERLSTKNKNTVYIAMTKEEFLMKRSFSNFGNMQVGDIRNLNPIDVATYKFLLITNPEAAVKTLEAKVQQDANPDASMKEKKEIKSEANEPAKEGKKESPVRSMTKPAADQNKTIKNAETKSPKKETKK